MVDALGVFSAAVELEVEFRGAPEAEAATQAAADEAGRPPDRPDRGLAFLVVAEHGKPDLRVGAVGAEGEIGDARERRPGILYLPAQYVRQLPAQQVACAGLGYGCHRVLERRLDGFVVEGLDQVAGLDVLEAVDADAAVEAASHFRRVVLEAAQRTDPTLVNDDAVPDQTDL